MNKVSFLEKSIKEHDNSREGRLKDLEKKIKETKAQLQSASKDLKVGFNSAEGLISIVHGILFDLTCYSNQLDLYCSLLTDY